MPAYSSYGLVVSLASKPYSKYYLIKVPMLFLVLAEVLTSVAKVVGLRGSHGTQESGPNL